MDFYKVPIGFGMALAMNQPAMNAYAAMTEQQKQTTEVMKAHGMSLDPIEFWVVMNMAYNDYHKMFEEDV